jgi:DNA-directed RNA polymerase specialized sigma24 family protein
MHDLDEHVSRIRDGDADAFGRWLAGAEGTLRLSLRSFASQVDTEAALQEALLRVWQVAPRFEPDGRPNGLLRLGIRIARNVAISERRRLHGTRADEGAADAELDAMALLERAGVPDPLLRRVIADCRSELPDKPALALDARLASGGAEADDVLAERLSMRKNTFLQNFTRARKLLADCLRRHGVDLDAELR